jgi:hypothetical protein
VQVEIRTNGTLNWRAWSFQSSDFLFELKRNCNTYSCNPTPDIRLVLIKGDKPCIYTRLILSILLIPAPAPNRKMAYWLSRESPH